jgi:HEAT repeat protein
VNRLSSWGKTPRQSIEQECALRGKGNVVAGCMALLGGQEVDAELIIALGGPPARGLVACEASWPDYWLRVWAARGLLWAWDDEALASVEAALDDTSWRVREMALKVVARHHLVDVVVKVSDLQADPVPRVRMAAERALIRMH